MLVGIKQFASDTRNIAKLAMRRYFEPLIGVFGQGHSYFVEKESLVVKRKLEDLNYLQEQRDRIAAAPSQDEILDPELRVELITEERGEPDATEDLASVSDFDLNNLRRTAFRAARIRQALKEDRLELYRQSILPLQEDMRGAHYEIFPRMFDRDGAVVTPSDFFIAAERFNVMSEIDHWVLEEMFRWLASEPDEKDQLALCVTRISDQSLNDVEFFPFVVDQLRESDIEAGQIGFGITETAVLANFDQALHLIQSCKEIGIRLVLDDFGTGLSSFSYLKGLPVDYLRIDASFVREIVNDPIDREMVRSINDVAHLLGKMTIAEGAKNEKIIRALRETGVDFAQGSGVSVARLATEPLIDTGLVNMSA